MIAYEAVASGEETLTLTRERTMRLLRQHGIATDPALARSSTTDLALFLAACGDSETYDAGAVLRWLGY